jgi:hypothetical protein
MSQDTHSPSSASPTGETIAAPAEALIAKEPSALSAYYRFEAGAPLAYGGVLGALVLALAAGGAHSTALWLAAGVALLIGLHNWPMVRQLATAMSVSDYGFFLDGLGLVSWSGIKSARVEERKLGKTKLAELVLDLDAEALKSVLSAPPAAGLRRLQYRPFRIAKGHMLRVDLQPLGVDPKALIAAIAPRLPAGSSES